METATNENLGVAQIIAQQLGSRTLFMLGTVKGTLCATVHGGMPGLSFRFRGCKRGNVLRVLLDRGSDTYRVDLAKIGTARSGYRMAEIASCEDVYAESLHRVIEHLTGLATSL